MQIVDRRQVYFFHDHRQICRRYSSILMQASWYNYFNGVLLSIFEVLLNGTHLQSCSEFYHYWKSINRRAFDQTSISSHESFQWPSIDLVASKILKNIEILQQIPRFRKVCLASSSFLPFHKKKAPAIASVNYEEYMQL